MSSSVQLKYKFSPKLTAYAGPYIGVLIFRNISTASDGLTSNMMAFYRKSDFGVNLAESLTLSNKIDIKAMQAIGLRNLQGTFYAFHPLQGNWTRNISVFIGLSYQIE